MSFQHRKMKSLAWKIRLGFEREGYIRRKIPKIRLCQKIDLHAHSSIDEIETNSLKDIRDLLDVRDNINDFLVL